MKPVFNIEYFPKCGWLLRAAYMAQEILTTFSEDVQAVSLQPAEVSGTYTMYINGEVIFDRKTMRRFCEIRELKQIIRNKISPNKIPGHSDKSEYRIA